MSEVTRICAQCGQPGPLEARFCPHCGRDVDGDLAAPVVSRNLPMALGKAALPILAGVAGLVARAAWRLLQSRLEQAITPAPQAQPPVAQPKPPPPARPRRVIRIRTAWAVGDGRGVWRQGQSDQTIEIEE